jgi:NAD(P)-dependent dehydrogenase (short-subunit alcohol dehydrogenase family)
MSRTWFITGAASGFGRELTERLLDRGERVAATARTPERLSDLTARYGDRLWTAALDVTDTAAVRQVVDRAFTELGRIDVIVSNAGRGAFGAAEELTDSDIDQQIALNLVAPIQLTRAVLPHLRTQGGGRIVQISTMGGQFGSAGGSLYHASKWGVEGFFESIVGEVAPFGVEITLVEPGGARTGFGRALTIADPLEAYAGTPVGQMRAYIASATDGDLTGQAPGDPAKIAQAIIDSADLAPAPLRLPLGSDAYAQMHGALSSRLTELEAAQQIALSTDVDGYQGAGVVTRSGAER